ncbi:hypothetical protein OSTOST_13279 [Ostertagia ostertagi]
MRKTCTSPLYAEKIQNLRYLCLKFTLSARKRSTGTDLDIHIHEMPKLRDLLSSSTASATLPQLLKTSLNIRVQVYADDVKIYGCYNENNRDEVSRALEQSIEKLDEWARNFDLMVNLSKCFVLHIGDGVPLYHLSEYT